MMSLRTAFMFVSTVTTFAHKADPNAENDSLSLLQATVEAQRGTKTDFIDVDGDDDYQLADPLNCANEKAAASPVELVAEPAAVAPQELEQAELDPPGADLVKMVLQAMTVLLVLDGIWKCYLQRQEVETKDGKCNQAKHAEAEAQAAWIKMIKAAKSGDESSFMESLALHPVVMRADAWGCTPLHFAAAGGSATITSELLKLGAEVDALDAIDETPLHMAARAGGVSISELLLKAGANIDAVNNEGMTPMVVSGHANQEPTCRFLADSGAGVAGLADEELPPLVVSQVVRKVLAAVVI